MNPTEHYFENLLLHGKDINGDPNKNTLSKEVQETIEICANYILYGGYLDKFKCDERKEGNCPYYGGYSE